MKAARAIQPPFQADTVENNGPSRLRMISKASNGIQKLRELILELAMRGKLVPQDPKDAHVTELLKRIHDKKEKMAKEGKLKRVKPSEEIATPEHPFSLPVNWVWARLEDVTTFGSAEKAVTLQDETWVLDLEDIQKDTSVLLQKVRFRERSSKSDKNVFYSGDVLYGKLRPYLNKVIVADEGGVCTTEILPLRWISEGSSKYLMYALKRPDFLRYVNSRSYGMKMPRLGTDDGRKALIPVPPINEQQRIVAKVDELMALCDRLEAQEADAAAAHEMLVKALLGTLTQSQTAREFQENWQRIAKNFDTLFTTESSIDTLKQTILQLAVMGKLVSQNPKDEPATELLRQIEIQKKRLRRKSEAKGALAIEIENAPHILPPPWAWAQLGNITEVGTGSTPSRTQPLFWNRGSIPWITSGSTSKTLITAGDEFVTKEAVKAHRLKLYQPGTLLVALYGQGKTRGQVTTLGIEATVNQACAAICALPGIETMQPYLKLLLLKNYVEIRSMSAGGAQPNLNLQKIKEILVPLPPLAEQQRIITKVDELMALCDTLKDRLAKAHTLHEHLAAALVEKAVL